MDFKKVREACKEKTFKTFIPSTKKEVYGKPYSLNDEVAMASVLETKNMELFFSQIQNIVGEKYSLSPIELDELTMVDLQWLVCQLKKNSDGNILTLSLECPFCKKSIKTELNIDEIKLVREENFSKILDVNENMKMEIGLPKCSDFYFILGDMKDVNEEENVALITQKGIELFIASIKCFYIGNDVEYVTDEDRHNPEFANMVSTQYREQFLLFQHWLEKESPALKYENKIDCDNCHELITLSVDDFFYSML